VAEKYRPCRIKKAIIQQARFKTRRFYFIAAAGIAKMSDLTEMYGKEQYEK
jgi:hypothetical protein